MCICPCNCTNGKENIERDQRKRLLQFLMGLDEGYSNIRGQILLMYPLPTVVKAYDMELHKPKSHKSEELYRGESSAIAERRSIFKKGVYCGNCTKQSLKSSNDTRNYRPVNMVMGQNKQITMGQSEKMEALTSHNNSIPDSHVSARVDQLQNQLNQVLMMLQANKEPYAGKIYSNSSHIPKFTASLICDLIVVWIIDSGASDHICTTLDLMIDL
ncbi:hypothetical protein Tco_0758005 [Tanacetum coccineum]